MHILPTEQYGPAVEERIQSSLPPVPLTPLVLIAQDDWPLTAPPAPLSMVLKMVASAEAWVACLTTAIQVKDLSEAHDVGCTTLLTRDSVPLNCTAGWPLRAVAL
jgi:hypothetical protein